MQTMIGVIGGSGIYDVEGLEGASWVKVPSPWGSPSDAVLVGRLDGVPMAFLPRHGRGHVHSPTTVPYRANIDALKRLGVTDVISGSAVGSFREAMAPGESPHGRSMTRRLRRETVAVTGGRRCRAVAQSPSRCRGSLAHRQGS